MNSNFIGNINLYIYRLKNRNFKISVMYLSCILKVIRKLYQVTVEVVIQPALQSQISANTEFQH